MNRRTSAGERHGVPRAVHDQLAQGAPTDGDLLAGIARGDHLQFVELHGRYLRRCLSVARRVLAQNEGTADVVQAVFLDIWQHREAYDETCGSVSSWLLAITHHRAVDHVRREEKQRRLQAEAGRSPAPAPVLDPAASVIRAAEQRQVVAALETLVPAQRDVVVLAYYGGHSQSQIAALLELPLGTVKSRTRDALRILRKQLTV